MAKQKKGPAPLTLIEQGIEAGNWHLVVDGYNRLTGSELDVPDVSEQTSVDLEDRVEELSVALRNIIRVATRTLENDEEHQEEEEDDEQEPHTPQGTPSLAELDQEFMRHVERVCEENDYSSADSVSEAAEEYEDEEGEPPSRLDRARAAAEDKPLDEDEDPLAKFRVNNTGPKSNGDGEGKNYGRKVAWTPPKNEFVDDGSLATGADLEMTKILNKTVQPKARRPAFRRVPVVCVKCDGDFKVHPNDAPKTIGDTKAEYTCDDCLGGRGKRGRKRRG